MHAGAFSYRPLPKGPIVLGDTVRTLAADPALGPWRREPAATRELFTRFDLRDPAFLSGAYSCPDFIRVSEESGNWIVEARTGSLYDFFRERLENGRYLMRVARPVTFAWRATEEAA